MNRKTEFRMAVLLSLAVSCAPRGLDLPSRPGSRPDALIGHGCIVLGERLDDPYSVDNMTKALASLYPTKADRIVVPTTDWYVRFLPADEEQYTRLERMGLLLLDHPMDYEILQEGDWYHDPAVPEDRITWQYAVVKPDFDFPQDIPYELLDKCYIPVEESGTKADALDWAAVERESFRLTGNPVLPADAGASRSVQTKAKDSATPSGCITIVDEALGGTPEGVRGVRVSCNSFVKTAYAYTDAEGRYTMTRSFSSKPRYRLVFKNKYGFTLGMNKILVPASVSTLGTGEAGGLDVNVGSDSDRRLFARCVVNNAGYDYFQACEAERPGIKPPPSNLRLWLFQHRQSSCTPMLQQGVLVDESRLGGWLGDFSFLLKMFLPDALVGLGGQDSYADIYSQTLQEFAHASHFASAGSDYWDRYIRYIVKSFVGSGFVAYGVGTEEDHGYCEVAEMWAYFIRHVLYRERYGETPGTVGMNFWFHPQIFLQLEERGLSPVRIFQVLNAEVTDREILQKKLISYYPEYKSPINQAFARYN